MIDLLQTHIEQCIAPALGADYLAAFELTEQLNLDSDEFYSDLFMRDANNQVENINAVIHDAVMSDIYAVLTTHGVGVSLEAPLDRLLPILKFFTQIENTEFIDSVSDIVQDDGFNTNEKLAACINIVTGYSEEDLHDVLVDVPESVITGLNRYMESRRKNEDPIEEQDPAIHEKYVKMLGQYIKIVQGNDMRCYQHASIEGVELGLPLEYYWALYRDYLTTIPMEAMIYEMIGFCLISESFDKNPTTMIAPIIEKYYGSDIDKISQANIIISNTLINIRNSAGSGTFQAPV